MTNSELEKQINLSRDFFVVIDGNEKIVWRDVEMTQGAAYGCAYISRTWAEKKAAKVGGNAFVYKVHGLYHPDFNMQREADHIEVAAATPFYNK